MKAKHSDSLAGGKVLLNLSLIVFIILPFTAAGIWGAIKLHTSIFPIDPDITMPIFPQGVAFLLFLFLGMIMGGLLGGFLWAAVAKQFMTRDEVYHQAHYGVRIPFVTGINKAFLRWLFRSEAKKR